MSKSKDVNVGDVGLALLTIKENDDIGYISEYARMLKKGGSLLIVSKEEDLGYIIDDTILKGLDMKRLLINVPKTFERKEGRYSDNKLYITWAVNVSKNNKPDERWIFNKPEDITFHTGAFEQDNISDLYKELVELHTNEDTKIITNKKSVYNLLKDIREDTNLVELDVNYFKESLMKIGKGKHKKLNIKLNEIVQEDCFDLLANMQEESVDLVVTDPPYNISVENSEGAYGKGRHGMNFGCVTEDVGIFTDRGHKKYHELKVGDLVTTYNKENDMLELQPVQKINVYDVKEELVCYYHTKEETMYYFTKNHRHVFMDNGGVKVEEIDYPHDFTGLSFHMGRIVKSEFEFKGYVEYEGKVWCPTVENGTWVAVYNNDYIITGNSWDFGFDTEKWLNYLAPVVKEGGSVIIFNSYKNIGIMTKVMKEYGYELRGIPFWLKTNPMPHLAERRYVSSMEHAVWFVRTNGKDVEHTFNLPEGSRFENGVFRVSHHDKQNERFHTTQKPVKLFNEIIRIHSNKGDVVLDTFMGSGTTAVCAQGLGRNFIGCELSDEYFGLTTARVTKSKKKPASLWG